MLDDWLASPVFQGKAMSVDKLQGFFCAVASAPDTILPGRWVPEALGSEPRGQATEQDREFMALMMRFYNSVASTLDENRPPEFILKPGADPQIQLDYQSWCEGYILGWGLSMEEWLSPGNELLKKLTFPILLLSGAFKEGAEERGEEYMPEDEYAQLLGECADVLPGAVAGIYNFWHPGNKPAPARRESPKVGRNDACPCGSGKKFKQCCGSAHTLH